MVARIVSAMVLALVFWIVPPVEADTPQPAPWTETGVQTRCDAAEGTFEIVLYIRPREGGFALQQGFKGIKEGSTLRGCKLGRRAVLARIEVKPETRTKICPRGGRIEIPSLSVDGVELEEQISTLTWSCSDRDDPEILRIKVRSATTGVKYSHCISRYAEDGVPSDGHCNTRSIAVEQQAAAFAKIDRDLADAATQAAQSATKLPASLDMTKVFAAQKDPAGLPVCAHWMQFAWTNEVQPWARIGGKEGERTPIYPVYPQACTAEADRTCDSSAYVLAGDRVDVSAVCGSWTAIRYRPRVRAFPETRGWVKTERLYGMQDLREPTKRVMRSQEKDPLNQAVAEGDAAAIADLLRNGTGPDGPDRSGQPLLLALMNDSLPAVEALLAGGATPDPGVAGWNRVGMSALMAVAKIDRLREYTFDARATDPIPLLKVLLQHGARLDAVDTYGQTALLRAMYGSNVDVVAFLLAAGADANKVRTSGKDIFLGYPPLLEAVAGYGWDHDPAVIRLLLEHGADPDAKAGRIVFKTPRLFKPLYVGYPGETAMTIAAREGYAAVVRDLLEHGADPVLPRGDGALPADIARAAGHPELAELLVEAARKKADPAP